MPVDLIGCSVYVDGGHYLDRYATLWRKKKTDKQNVKIFKRLFFSAQFICFGKLITGYFQELLATSCGLYQWTEFANRDGLVVIT